MYWAESKNCRMKCAKIGNGVVNMIKSVKVRNFRCFESLELSNLTKFNVIVGDNSSGKTALLESLFLLGGLSSEMFLRLKTFRLMPNITISNSRKTVDEIFGDYFYEFDTSRTIHLETKGTLAETRQVDIYFDEKEAMQVDLGESIEETQFIAPLTFKGKYDGSKTFQVQAKFEDSKLALPRFPAPVKAAFFASSTKFNPGETADRFSSLDASNQLKDVTDIFYEIYPWVKDLSIVTKDGIGMVWGRMEGRTYKQPLSLVSEGVNKLLQILLAIRATPYSYILLDEIENGFYYSRLPDIVRALYELANKSNVQLFVTTHSQEFLRAVGNVAQKHEKDFALLRTLHNGKEVQQFSGLTFRRAIDQHAELR